MFKMFVLLYSREEAIVSGSGLLPFTVSDISRVDLNRSSIT